MPAPPSRVSHASPTSSQANATGNGVQIKQEPSQNSNSPAMSMAPATGFTNAADRAAHLSQQYQQQRMDNQRYNPISLPQQQNQQGYSGVQYSSPQVYQQHQQQQQQQRMPQQQWGPAPQRDVKQYTQQQQLPDVKQQSPQIKQERVPDALGLSQTDGTGDEPDIQSQWSAVVAHRRELKADGEKTQQADRMLKRQLADQMHSLEAGGLLTPLDERYSRKQRTRGARHTPHPDEVSSSSHSAHGQSRAAAPPSRFDGGDDNDETDEDAINSALDDSEEEIDDGTVGEEYEGDTIICLYDKVQRVKNKWKCTLKDGVVNADGKE